MSRSFPKTASAPLSLCCADLVAWSSSDRALDAFARCADSACVCRVALSSWMTVDGAHQVAQHADRVDRIRNRAGDVFGHRRLHGEIAICKRRKFIEQPQDGLLVAFGFLALRERQRFAMTNVASTERTRPNMRNSDDHHRQHAGHRVERQLAVTLQPPPRPNTTHTSVVVMKSVRRRTSACASGRFAAHAAAS